MTRLRPLLTAILMGGAAGLVALATYQAMMALQRLIWETGVTNEAGPVRIIVTILAGGALLILLDRIAPSETVAELIRGSAQPWRSFIARIVADSRKVMTLAMIIGHDCRTMP